MTDPILLDCSQSPYSLLKPVPIDSVRFEQGFWAECLKIIKQITLPSQFDKLETTGRLDNFRRIPADKNKPFQGYFFNDSDVYKWLEAACWSLISGVEERTKYQIDEMIRMISAAQDQDGYLNTYFTGEKEKERWSNLRNMHELYCAGHLFQAGIAHYRVTGQDELLKVAVHLADHICNRYLDTGIPAVPGHPEIEMALVELYRTVGDSRYLQMAKSFLDQRGDGVIGGSSYHLDHISFREMRKLEGHAVRAMYLCCGATDIYLETGENLLLQTLSKLWEHMVSRQMYITGGVGSRFQGESFGDDFELPNARAYAESCAAIGSLMWNWRMLHSNNNPNRATRAQPNVKYADLIEWTLYNAVLPGIGLNGQEYHYVNPLEVYDAHARQPWFDCACCPPNIARLITSLGGYFYSHSEDNIWIHQYAPSHVEINLNNDRDVTFSVDTEFPWNGQIEINLLSVADAHSQMLNDPIHFGLNLRMPSWLQGDVPVLINGELLHVHGIPGSYLNIAREWVLGDKLRFEFPLPIRYLESHPYVQENSGRIAICRGPLLYCIEAHDNANIDPREVFLILDETPGIQQVEIQDKSFAGVLINAEVRKIGTHWMNVLYREWESHSKDVNLNNSNVIAIPYFSWGNRSRGWMQVWIKRK